MRSKRDDILHGESSKSLEEIARMRVNQRNEGRINNYLKTGNHKGLETMKQRNLEQYGNPDGPTPNQLYEEAGTI